MNGQGEEKISVSYQLKRIFKRLSYRVPFLPLKVLIVQRSISCSAFRCPTNTGSSQQVHSDYCYQNVGETITGLQKIFFLTRETFSCSLPPRQRMLLFRQRMSMWDDQQVTLQNNLQVTRKGSRELEDCKMILSHF